MIVEYLTLYEFFRIQIIQHKLDSLEIKILFDEELKNIGASNEEFISSLKEKILEKIGIPIDLDIQKVDNFEIKDPYYICEIDRNKFIEKELII